MELTTGIDLFIKMRGNIFKDANLGRGKLALCTSANNDFYGEPLAQIEESIKIEIVKRFNTKNKNKEVKMR